MPESRLKSEELDRMHYRAKSFHQVNPYSKICEDVYQLIDHVKALYAELDAKVTAGRKRG